MVNWNLINGNGRKFSSKTLRKNILMNMKKHHQGGLVDAIKRKYNVYKINLMSGLNLIFEAEGRYVKKMLNLIDNLLKAGGFNFISLIELQYLKA